MNSRPTRLTVVGSADAFNAAGRGHSCYLLEGPGLGPLMVDFGATALAGLRRLGRSGAELSAVLLTHLHGDHIGGLPFLLIDGMFHHRRTAPLELVGPPDSARRLAALSQACYGELLGAALPFELRHRSIEPGVQLEVAGARVRAYAAEHQDPPEVALCLRLTLPDGQVVAFSGDTALCQGLLDAAAGATLLVAECSAMAPPCGRHLTWRDWVALGRRLDADRVLLTHLGEEVRARAQELSAALVPPARLSFADDGCCLLL